MKNLKRIASISILIALILAVSVANAVNAAGEIHTINVGGYPNTLAYDLSKGEIYMTVFNANSGYDTVSVISDSSNSVVANLTVGNLPSDIAYDSAKGEVFVANSLSDTVSVIPDSSDTSSSPSPTIPEFTAAAIILLLVPALVTISAVALAVKKSTRSSHDQNR